MSSTKSTQYSFNSNVAPKKIKFAEKTPWYCHRCDKDVAAYFRKCPTCHAMRND